jgi:hypothetical protein
MMSEDMRRILAGVLYDARALVAPPDAAFDLEVAAFVARLDGRAADDVETAE